MLLLTEKEMINQPNNLEEVGIINREKDPIQEEQGNLLKMELGEDVVAVKMALSSLYQDIINSDKHSEIQNKLQTNFDFIKSKLSGSNVGDIAEKI